MADRANFINLMALAPSGSTDFPAAVFDELVRAQGTLPRTLYLSRSVGLSSYAEIPRAWTLLMAPGVVVTVSGFGGLVVRGPVDLGCEPRFRCPPTVQTETLHAVRLAGPLDAIEADWWLPRGEGAGVVPDGSSVQQALEALWWRYLQGLAPAPIALRGPYAVREPIVVEPPGDGYHQVRMIGQPRLGAPLATLRGGAASRPLETLMQVRRDTVLLLDNVGFDGSPGSGASPTPGARVCLDFNGHTEGSRLVQCAFQVSAGGVGLRVARASSELLDELHRLLAGIPLPGVATVYGALYLMAVYTTLGSPRDGARLDLDGCDFRCEGTQPMRFAVEVGAGDPLRLRASDSQFTGPATAMLAMLGGDLGVTACAFANTHVPAVGAPEHEGADIVFTALRDADAAVFGVLVAPTCLSVVHCISSSPSFLHGQIASSTFPRLEGGASISGLRHRPAVTRTGSSARSIRWRAGFGSRSLSLTACTLGGDVVLDANAPDTSVINLGVTFAQLPAGARVPGFAQVPASGGAPVGITDSNRLVVKVDTRLLSLP